ncbi:RNA polymerase factor sigma-54 [Moraxella sp. VT-16-12]|uniref:RNA polymerase factor sigma-54 n=1 Tax=Moraxella sp. VT-16-12 TaxID=2014877 RepID=UPI000B7D10C2|nr:RNA polymerase factor sigma-54 [Moraxella sp. VT-16-12]TWV84686.1 RNA polymerase factor sigma-54 [Moraxella sp. VT-16-12]
MSVSFGLGVNLSASQKLTPQMQQAIRLLALSNLELEQEVQLKLDSNPLLERTDLDDDYDEHDTPESLSLDDWTQNNWQTKTTTSSDDGFGDESYGDSFEKLSQSEMDADATDSNWDNVYAPDVDYDGDFSVHAKSDDDNHQDFLGATESTVQDHVRWQMNFKHLSQSEKLIADYLIDAMDEMGYIRLDIEELHRNLSLMASFYQWQEQHEISHAHIMTVLQSIQECSPTGVGARNLAECLRLQLNELIKDNPDLPFAGEAYMVLSATSHLENNNIKALMQATELNVEEIKGAMALIRQLDPEPASTFYRENNTHNEVVEIPDVLVIALDQQGGVYTKKSLADTSDTSAWRVMLNPDVLPNLKINQEYASLIKKGDESPDNVYLKEHLTDARLFIRSIEERNQNLLKVASSIVRRQQGFFEEGEQAMTPMTLKDIAIEVGLHESTVSRLTTNKTMLTPKGLFSLKYFFSSSVGSEDGDVSSTAISAKIREMIQAENPKKPLSDATITKHLENEGVSISRRTVTKYREMMGIPSSTLRKQKL